jgi:hypothetical protein
MKKKESTATKRATKSSPATKKKGRGGARPGAGRKKKYDDTQQINFDCPTYLIDAMETASITNKTEYLISLIQKDLKKKGVLS